jgi:hypothetical protein
MEAEAIASGYHVVVVLDHLTPSPPASHCAFGDQQGAAAK